MARTTDRATLTQLDDPAADFVDLLLTQWKPPVQAAATYHQDEWTGAARLACLNRAWQAAIHSWRGLQLSVALDEPDDAACLLIAKFGQLRSIELLSFQRLGRATSLRAVLHGCQQLESLALHNGRFQDELFDALEPGALAKLRTLKLHNCFRITGAAVLQIAQRCPQLETLELDVSLDDETLSTIVGSCRRLESFSVHNCPCLTDAAARALVTSCERLRRLDLRHGNDHFPSAEAVALIGRSCPELRALLLSPRCFSDGSGAFSSALHAVARGCPHLEELDVSDCPLLEDSIVDLATHCPRLEALALPPKAATDTALAAIGANCPRLRSLHVMRGRLTDSGLGGLVARCPRLQVLHLSFCSHVGAAGLRAVAAHCRELRVLYAVCCKRDEGIEDAFQAVLAACELTAFRR